MASKHHKKTRESGESPNKDDERPPRKKTRNLDASPDKQPTASQDSELCVSCNSTVDTDGIECQWCKKWEHKVCAKLSDSEYNMLEGVSVNIMFFCSTCCVKVPQALQTYSDNVASPSLDQKLQNLSAALQDLEKELKECHSLLSTHPKITPSLKPVQTSSPVDVVDEYLDREKRKCNLIIYNLQESNASTPSDRTSDDKKSFAHLLASEFNIDNIEFLKCIRLGKPVEDKSRPLLISLADTTIKSNILRKASKLRKSTQYSGVFITPDMTKKEREAAKELRKELKRRKSQGEDNLIIRRGKIVERKEPPSESSDVNMDA